MGAAMQAGGAGASKALPSPPATAQVTLDGKRIVVRYNSPSMRGRKIMGGLVAVRAGLADGRESGDDAGDGGQSEDREPVGAGGDVHDLHAAVGGCVAADCEQADGAVGDGLQPGDGLGRTPMIGNPLAKAQEMMSISFENTKGKSTELHVKWEMTDEYVTITAQ